MNKLSSLLIALLFLTFCCNAASAQTQKGEFINTSIGIGMVAADDQADITGSGFYAQGEYVYNILSWFGLRPYAGAVFASGASDEPGMDHYKVKSNAFLLGGKARITAPIPYVAPFLESGIGMSIGEFKTYTPYTHLEKKGLQLHIPVTLGLAIGRNHDYELKFVYYFPPAAEQTSGALAIGYSFPLDRS